MTSSVHYFQSEWLPSPRTERADLVVYGATAAGLIAAIRAAQSGLQVFVAHPGLFLGGMTTGGLGFTDFGNKAIIGGLSREFYRRLSAHYGVHEVWKFEPGVARKVLEDWVAEMGIPILFGAFLKDVVREGNRIKVIRFLGGSEAHGRMFIDATYEGDLMARAGVSFSVGREGNSTYHEIYNGAQIQHMHQFHEPVDPYVVPGNPFSGLLPGIDPAPFSWGRGDTRVQAYNFRVCMTDSPENRVPFPQPEGYDPADYELAARWLRVTRDRVFTKFDRITPTKTDTNNHGAFSTDFIGGSASWPEGDFVHREFLFQAHVRYQQGLHWFMARDSRVPDPIRNEYSRWGLAADEFLETGHWPHQLYVREGRRMVSDAVVTEADCLGRHRFGNPVGMGAYNMDSHNCRRLVVDGWVKNEGDVQVRLPQPYPIPYEAIVPARGQAPNLFSPVCLSASHIAYGSVRMEPVFMVLADSAAQAAVLALDSGVDVQEVRYDALRERLIATNQVLSCDAVNGEGNPI